VSDRLYFGFWTFPPYKWLYFNISQSLAVLYGRMPWHYYLSQGVPLLTTTFLPFTLVGLYKAASAKGLSTLQSNILKTLNFAALTMIAVLSLISHKEVRFIYPLLPILHILAAPYIAAFFIQPPTAAQPTSPTAPITLRHKLTLTNLLSLNLLLAGYLSLFHQPAPLSVLSFLRTDFERIHPNALDLTPLATANPTGEKEEKQKELFALFLTPCHSTPWRSHLVYPALRARALTCEPPLHTAPGTAEREAYLDEADRFYLKDSDEEGKGKGKGGYGVKFLAEEIWPLLPPSVSGNAHDDDNGTPPKQRGGEIPRYIIGFEGIEPVLKRFFEEGDGDKDAPGRGMGVTLRRVWSAWNGAFNEDWRRRGRLVVWDTGVYGGSFKGSEGVVEGAERVEEAEGESESQGGRVIDEL
jgi:phosphatidylinositol glycan class B